LPYKKSHKKRRKTTKKKVLLAIVAVFAFVFSVLTYPSESGTSKTNLEYLLSQRMSIRNWSDAPIEDEVMKAICKNSFASAFDLEGMELYISNSTRKQEIPS
jgi:hypothetical protein